MDAIVDTNIVAAAIIRNGDTRRLLFSPSLALFSPDFLVEELDEKMPIFLSKSGLGGEEYKQIVSAVLSNITQIPANQYIHLKKEALATSPDPDDWAFFAAAIFRSCPIWSNDSDMKKQKLVAVHSTKEIFDILEGYRPV